MNLISLLYLFHCMFFSFEVKKKKTFFLTVEILPVLLEDCYHTALYFVALSENSSVWGVPTALRRELYVYYGTWRSYTFNMKQIDL